jgi:protein disulfide-isomerase
VYHGKPPSLEPGRFNGAAVTQEELEVAQSQAHALNKFLMIEFGANWCSDCRALSHQLGENSAKDLLREHFVILNVDVGQFDRNLEVAKSLGVDIIGRGIPTAVFVSPDRHRSTKYGTRDIQAFLRNLADDKRLTSFQ